MTAGDPDHPITSVDELANDFEQKARDGGIADALRQARPGVDVDLTGVGSGAYVSPFTTGAASVAEAVVGGFAGRPQGPSLARQLAAWQERRAAESAPQTDVAKAIADDPELREHVAGRFAMHAMGDHMASTGDSTGAQHVGFAKYRELGGRKSFSAFKSDLKRS